MGWPGKASDGYTSVCSNSQVLAVVLAAVELCVGSQLGILVLLEAPAW